MEFTTPDAPNNWIVYDRIDFNSISSVMIIPLQQPNYLLWRKIRFSNFSCPASYTNISPETSCFHLGICSLYLGL